MTNLIRFEKSHNPQSLLPTPYSQLALNLKKAPLIWLLSVGPSSQWVVLTYMSETTSLMHITRSF